MQTRDRIALAMAESLRRQGYAASGIKQVLDAADAPNGSLYHHFRGGKSEVAALALRQMGAAYAELVGGLLAAESDLPTAIRSAFEAAAEHSEQSGWMNLCPVGTVAGEIADVQPALREVAAEIFEAWIDGCAALFIGRGVSPTDARTLGQAIISALEGAFVLARTLHTGEPIRAAGTVLGGYAETLIRSPLDHENG